jgi:hypothetical protein
MSDITPLTINNGYIVLPVTTDPNAMVQAALATIAANLPGWVPQEGQLDVLLLEQFAQMASESATVAAQVPPAIFQYFGSLVNIFPIAGAASQATTTWTMVSSAGFTVPAGTLVAYQTLGNVQVQFATVNAFTVPPGSSTATGVIIQATTTGAVNNSIADSVPVVLVNQLAFVSSVVATSTTSGGANPESLATYLNRLSAELQLLSPRPILPQDFAALATNVAGVYRAMAINLLAAGRTITGTITLATTTALVDTAGSFSAEDVGRLVTGTDIPSSTTISAYVSTTQVTMSHAATGSLTTGTVVLGDLTGVERCVTVAAVDIDGNALSPTVTAALQAYLEGQREINFLVFVISPTYTEIDVTWSGIAQVGANITTVQAAGDAAVSAYLSPSNWGLPSVDLAGTLTAGSDIVTGVVVPANAQGNPAFEVEPGQPISGYGIPTNTAVISVNNDGSVTISNPATASGTAVLTLVLAGTWDPTATTVNYLGVVGVLAATPGLWGGLAVTINIHGNSPGTANLSLPGDAPLTTVGTISGAVSAHS